jgi:hypothetical protein
MITYSFSLVITPPLIDEEDAADKLYKNGCDDALFAVTNGEYSITFDRESSSLQQAIDSAINNLEQANIGSTVKRSIYLGHVAYPVRRKRNNV